MFYLFSGFPIELHAAMTMELLLAIHATASETIRDGTPELIVVPSRNSMALPSG
jgi:hypothetical protein